MVKLHKTKTLLLAGVGIVVLMIVMIATVIRLKQYATVPVAPNAPISQPRAAEVNENCTTDSDCNAGYYCYQPPMPTCPVGQSCAQVMPQKICQEVVAVAPRSVCNLSFTLTASACGNTCTVDASCGAGLSCQTVDGAKKCVNPSCSSDSDCVCPSTSPTPSPTPTPTPTPEPAKCNIVCNPNASDTGCSDGYTCEPNSRRCRKPECPAEGSCNCPVDTCNTTCNPNVSDTGCTDGLVCEPISRKCRKSACTSESDCDCAAASPTPTPTSTSTTTSKSSTPVGTAAAAMNEEVMKAGTIAPSALFILMGGLLVALGVLAVSW